MRTQPSLKNASAGVNRVLGLLERHKLLKQKVFLLHRYQAAKIVANLSHFETLSSAVVHWFS